VSGDEAIAELALEIANAREGFADEATAHDALCDRLDETLRSTVGVLSAELERLRTENAELHARLRVFALGGTSGT
jgi:hypothetical protein